jgi:hypothetical protein
MARIVCDGRFDRMLAKLSIVRDVVSDVLPNSTAVPCAVSPRFRADLIYLTSNPCRIPHVTRTILICINFSALKGCVFGPPKTGSLKTKFCLGQHSCGEPGAIINQGRNVQLRRESIRVPPVIIERRSFLLRRTSQLLAANGLARVTRKGLFWGHLRCTREVKPERPPA